MVCFVPRLFKKMDLDLDNDLVYENDRIKSFLQDKLQEIKISNNKIRDMIEKRKQSFSNTPITDDNLKNTNIIKLLHHWKTFYNNKCAFGFTVQNCSESKVNISKIFLKSDSSTYFDFSTYIFKENYEIVSNKSTDFNSYVYLVIVTSIPQFTTNLCCTLNGAMFVKQGKSDFIQNLPSMNITSKDITNSVLSDIILKSEGVPHFLTVKSCSLKINLVMLLVESSATNVISLFEIHCFLTSMYFQGSHNRYFAANKICPTFDNSLIEVHDSNDEHIYNITVYTKNDETLTAFLHHLHQNITGVIIIPKSCFDNFQIDKILNKYNENDEINNFKNCIKKEIAIVHNYKQYLGSTRKDCDIYLHLRKKLLDAEKNTDFSYLKITSNT